MGVGGIEPLDQPPYFKGQQIYSLPHGTTP